MSSATIQMSRHERRKANTALRNAAITDKFSELYHCSRIRFDDVINQLASQFALSIKTIERILGGKR